MQRMPFDLFSQISHASMLSEGYRPNATDRRAIDMDIASDFASAQNTTVADQFAAARRTLSSIFEDSFAGSMDPAEVTENFTRAHLGLLLDDDPGWKATEALFGDFLRFVLLHPTPDQVFDLLRNFESLCNDQVLILRKIIERGAPGKQKFTRTVEMLRYVEVELWTWRLIRMFYEDRALENERKEELSKVTDEQVRLMNDLEKWNFLHIADRRFRELRLIVKWSQQCASDLLGSQDHSWQFEGKTFLWENTLHQLRSGMETQRKLVKSMDPDAPLRENAHLDDTDEADEQRLLKLVFGYIRAGQIEKAIDLCVQCGQPWRGAQLTSAIPYYGQSETSLEMEPNKQANRDIWRRTMWQFCNEPKLPSMERAIYGSFCGHFASVRSYCSTWEDALWAYAISASEHLYDDFLRRTAIDGKRKFAELPQTSTLNQEAGQSTLEEILNKLETSENQKISQETKTLFRRLHAFIFLDQPDQAVANMHQYLVDYADETPSHLVRLMAHVVLVFNLCSLDISATLANGILDHYVRVLIDDNRMDLIAFYSAMLPPDLQRTRYSKFLEGIDGKEQRLHYLSLAEKAGMNVPYLCLTVVDNMRQAFEPTIGGERSFLSTSSISMADGTDDITTVVNAMTADVNERDLRLISAVEWLLFYRELHGEAVRHANAIGRIFLVGRNLAAAKALFTSLPPDILKSAVNAWLNTDDELGHVDDQQLPLEQRNQVREFHCHQAYLDAHIAFQRWFEHYYRKKPELETPDQTETGISGAMSFQQRAAIEMKKSQHEENVAIWNRDLLNLAESSVQLAYDVLLYPDAGWMVDEAPKTDAMDTADEPIEPDRKDELMLLRKRCLPLITDMIITVLENSGRYREAIQVADAVASEENALYKVFTKDQLKHMVSRLANVSMEAMNSGLDI